MLYIGRLVIDSLSRSSLKRSPILNILWTASIGNTLCWDAHIDFLIYSYCQEWKCYYLEGTEYCFTTLTFCIILISVVLSGVLVVLHWKINFQKSRSNLRLWFYTPSSELFKELNLPNIPPKSYKSHFNALNNLQHMCWIFKKNMSHILLTYHVEILDLLTVTNYRRQNLTANFSASPSCTLELSSGILPPYMLKMQLRLTLLNLYI